MKVVVREIIGFGGSNISVYKYSKKKYIQMVEKDLNEGDTENEDNVEEWIEESKHDKGIPCDISVIKRDFGIHYNVCEVKET